MIDTLSSVLQIVGPLAAKTSSSELIPTTKVLHNDLAYLIYELLNSEYFGPINISSGEKTIIKDLIIKAAKYFNKEKLINFDSSLEEPKFPLVVADTSLIKKVLKIKYPEKVNSRFHETFNYWQKRLSSIN